MKRFLVLGFLFLSQVAQAGNLLSLGFLHPEGLALRTVAHQAFSTFQAGNGQGIQKSASWLRKAPGVGSISKKLQSSERMLRGTNQNAGLVPREIGERLDGKNFKNFTQFRQKFWKATAGSKYAREFSERDLLLMRKGKAPFADECLHTCGQTKYELHHLKPIKDGGAVYDLSNIAIAAPLYHREVFHRGF